MKASPSRKTFRYGFPGPAEPKDTFDDPYLAYAAVEQALMKTSAKMQAAAQKVYETENVIDQLTYWK